MDELPVISVSYNTHIVTEKIFDCDLWVQEIRKLGLTLLFYGIDLERLVHSEVTDRSASPFYIALGLANRSEPKLFPANYSHGYPFLRLLFRCLKPWKWSREGKHAVIITESNIELNIGEYALGGFAMSTPADKRLVAYTQTNKARSFICCDTPDAGLSFMCYRVGKTIVFLITLWGSEEGRSFHIRNDIGNVCRCDLEERLNVAQHRHNLNFQEIQDVYSMPLLRPATALGQKNANPTGHSDYFALGDSKRGIDSGSPDGCVKPEGWVKQGNGKKIILRYGPPNAARYRIVPAKYYEGKERVVSSKSPAPQSALPSQKVPPEIQALVLDHLDSSTIIPCIRAGLSVGENMYKHLYVWKSVFRDEFQALEHLLGPSGNAYLIGLGAQQLYTDSSFKFRELRPALSIIFSWPKQSIVPLDDLRFNNDGFATVLNPFLRLHIANSSNRHTVTLTNPGELIVRESTGLKIPFLRFRDRDRVLRKTEVQYENIRPGSIVSVIHQYKFMIDEESFCLVQGDTSEEPWHLSF